VISLLPFVLAMLRYDSDSGNGGEWAAPFLSVCL
jgi:hypothetical protein